VEHDAAEMDYADAAAHLWEGLQMMLLVRIIDLVVSMLRYLASPEGRLLRVGVLVVGLFGALVGAAGIIWALAQLPHYFAGP
jgi:hypothetical protein